MAKKDIAVGIYTDALLEENETFKIILTNESENAIIGSKNETVITIIDDDNETIWEHQYKSRSHNEHITRLCYCTF